LSDRLTRLRAQRSAAASQDGGIYQNFDPANPLVNARYVADLRAYFRERGITGRSDQELQRLALNDSNIRDFNTVASFFGARGSSADIAKYSQGESAISRAARLHLAVQQHPNIFQQDGRSFGEAFPSIAKGILTDPVNYALGAVSALSGGAAAPFAAGARGAVTGAGRKALMSGVSRGAMTGAKWGAVEGAVGAGIQSVGEQRLARDLGLSDGVSAARVAQDAAIGTVMGTGIGSVFGGAGGVVGAVRGRSVANQLLEKGYTTDEVSRMLDTGAQGLRELQQIEPDLFRQRIAEAEGQETNADPVLTEAEAAQKAQDDELAGRVTQLQSHLQVLHRRLADLTRDRIEESNPEAVASIDEWIETTQREIVALEEAKSYPQKLASREAIARELLASPNPDEIAQGRDLMGQIASDRARLASIVERGTPEDVENFVLERSTNRQIIDQGRNVANEEGAIDSAAQRAALAERTKAARADARKTAQGEAVVAGETGALAARTDETIGPDRQATLTDEQVTSTQVDDRLAAEAEAIKAERAAEASGADPSAEPVAIVEPPEEPATPPSPPRVPVTQSTRKGVNASKWAVQEAERRGIDLNEVTGTGTNGRIRKSDIVSHAKTNGPSETYTGTLTEVASVLEAVQPQLAERGLTEANLSTLLNNPKFLRRAAMAHYGEAADPATIDAMVDVFSSAKKAGDMPQVGNTIFNAPSFKGRLGDLQDELVARSQSYQRERTPHDPMASKSGRIVDQASPMVDEEGKLLPGVRIQSLLRRGRTFNPETDAEYSITGEVPDPSRFSLAEAQARARSAVAYAEGGTDARKRRKQLIDQMAAAAEAGDAPSAAMLRGLQRDPLVSSIQPFLSNGRVAVVDSAAKPKRDDVLFVSGRSGKVYADWRGAYAEGGLKIPKGAAMPEELVSLVEMAKLSSSKPTRSRQASSAQPSEGGSLSDVAAALKSSSSNSAPAAKSPDIDTLLDDESVPFDDLLEALASFFKASPSAQPLGNLPPLTKGDQVLFFHNPKTGRVIAPSRAQVEAGKSTRDIFGTRKIDEWEYEYLPDSVERNEIGYRKQKGLPIDGKAKPGSSGKALEGAGRERPVDLDDVADAIASTQGSPRLAELVSDLNSKLAQTPNRGAALRPLDESFTFRDLSNLELAMQRLPVSATDNNTYQIMRAISEIEAEVAPYGIRAPMAVRDEAIEQIHTVFAKLPISDVEPMVALVNRLANGEAPQVALGSKAGADSLSPASYDADLGTIFIGQKVADGTARSKITPVHHTFFHEVGHWAHLNFLGSKDRAEFWGWMADNVHSREDVGKVLGVTGEGSLAKQAREYFDSPAELFAEMFARWATGQIPEAQAPAIWQRFAKYIKGLFDTLLGRSTAIDPEVERLFAKVLPTEQVERIADDAAAIKNGAARVESLTNTSPDLRGPDADVSVGLDSGQADVPARVDFRLPYYEMGIKDLKALGDPSRGRQIGYYKSVYDDVSDVRRLWESANDTGSAELFEDAYRATHQLIVGKAFTGQERQAYLRRVAKAKGEKLDMLSRLDGGALAPFEDSPYAIIARAKKVLRRLNRAHAGKDFDSVDLSNDSVDAISAASAADIADAGGAYVPNEARMEVLRKAYTGGDDTETGLAKLLDDMQTAINTSFTESGVLPVRGVDLAREVEGTRVPELALGRFSNLIVGDQLRYTKGAAAIPANEKRMDWTITDLIAESDGSKGIVIRSRNNGQVKVITDDAEMDKLTRRHRAAKSRSQAERARRENVASVAKVKRDIHEELKRQAYAKAKERLAGIEQVRGYTPVAASPKTVDAAQLIDRFAQTGEPQVADEILAIDFKAPQSVEGIKANPPEEAAKGIRQIRYKLLSGDPTVDADVAGVRPDQVRLSPVSPTVNLAVRRELEEGIGTMAEAGIPASTTPQMKDLLSVQFHRKRDGEYVGRTLAYRLARIADPRANDAPVGPMFTPNTEEWQGLRRTIRTISAKLTGAEPPHGLAKDISNVLFDTEPRLLRRASENGFDQDDAAELLEAILDPTGGIDIDPSIRPFASELLDRAGYLVNGLVRGKHARNAMARLTYFNDMFERAEGIQPGSSPLSNMTFLEAAEVPTGSSGIARAGASADAMAREGFDDVALVDSEGNIARSAIDYIRPYLRLVLDGHADDPVIRDTVETANRLLDHLNRGTETERQASRAALDHHLTTLSDAVEPPRFSVVAIKSGKSSNTAFQMAEVQNELSLNSFFTGVREALDDGDLDAQWEEALDQVVGLVRPGMTNAQLFSAFASVGRSKNLDPSDVVSTMGFASMVDAQGYVTKTFSPTKPIEDFSSPNLFHAPALSEEGAVGELGHTMTSHLLASSTSLSTFSAPPSYKIAKSAPDQGTVNWLLRFGRNRKPTGEDLSQGIRLRHKWFGLNSQVLRSGGLNQLADFFQTHWPNVSQDFARRLFGSKSKPGPLAMIRSLSDAPSPGRRWLTDANPLKGDHKVESWDRILRALQEPSNPRLAARLSADEAKALKSIRDTMGQIFFDLTDAGVMMGSRGPNYFPQIWSSMAIRRDPQKFQDALVKYYRIEATKAGRAVDEDTLKARAMNVYRTLSDEAGEALFNDDFGQSYSGAAENIDASRKIELDRHPEALADLRPFLESDLESYLVKYVDQASHRLSLAHKFGHRNHGFSDYMAVVTKGREGIAELLSRRRTQEHKDFVFDADGGMVERAMIEEFPMPFEEAPGRAMQAADDVVAIFKASGEKAARAHLLSMAVPDARKGGGPSIVYQRRVDAIIDGLKDTGGEAKGKLTMSDMNFINNMMKVASRRPLRDANTLGVEASKALRTFNSVTLLGYTVISSLGDSMLPIVRSGELRSAMKAWASYMSDPDYRQAMKNIGTASESLLHNRMTYMNGTPANRLSSAFFNAIGLTPWTDEMRGLASGVAFEALNTSIMKTNNTRFFDPSRPLARQSATFKRHWRFLKRYGLEDRAGGGDRGGQLISQADLDGTVPGSDAVRIGMTRFVDDAVFSPNPDQIPQWAQMPWGAVIFQLKSFPLMMQRMAKEVLYDDIRLAINDLKGRPLDLSDISGTGNTNRAMYLLSLLPMMGIGVNFLHDNIRARGGEEGNERAPGDRSMSKILREFPLMDDTYEQGFGLLENIADRETLDAAAGQLISGFSTAAGLGLFASMLTDTAQQAENGQYGVSRMMSVVFGPSAGTAISGMHVLQGALDEKGGGFAGLGAGEKTFPERQATREIFQRIPVLGGQRGIRDMIVEKLAPAGKRGRGSRSSAFEGGGFEDGGFE